MEGHATSLNFYARKFYLRMHVKLRDSGNPPLEASTMSHRPWIWPCVEKSKENELTAER